LAPAAGPKPLDREIARLAIPAFGALIAEPLYVLTDTAVVGHLGTPQLAGLAVASSVLLTLYAVFIFLAYGTTAAVSGCSARATSGRRRTRRSSRCGWRCSSGWA
jgi:Na+-driven multidrug efflux pump